MNLYKAVRPKGYTGPVKEAPSKKLLGPLDCTEDEIESVLQSVYDHWTLEFFERNPRGTLKPTFGETSVLVRGTGDGGRWLVVWWVEN